MAKRIRNWAGNLRFTPSEVHTPLSEEEVMALVEHAARSGKKVRVAGTSHSWTPMIVSPDIFISLDRMQGIISINTEEGWIEVWAGTKLQRLNEELLAAGYALENMGDINVQSVAGALCTGTHGTGKNFGILATQLIGCTFINGKAELVQCGENENREIFRAVQVSLGTLGVITRMRLRIIPAFVLRYISKAGKLEEVLENFDQYVNAHRHFEFYWFPYTPTVQLKLVDETHEKVKGKSFWRQFDDVVIENIGYGVLSTFSKWFRFFTPLMCRISAAGFPKGTFIDQSHRIFATVRWVRFYEMEYNLPAENFQAAMREAVDTLHRKKYRVHMPFEVRYVKGDDIMISPANGRDSVYIAVHQIRGMEYEAYFRDMEHIFRKHGGRPHFGKMNTLSYHDFREIYPEFDRFCETRQQMDPEGLFLNDYLETLFLPGK